MRILFKIYEADMELYTDPKPEKSFEQSNQLLMIGLIVNSSRELLNKYQKMSSEDIFKSMDKHC